MRETAIILSVTSDIGAELALRWARQGVHVRGTYRTSSKVLSKLDKAGVELIQCDLENKAEIDAAAGLVTRTPWSRLVLAAGTQEPIGLFGDVSFDEWAESLGINLIGQLRFLHACLATSSPGKSRILFFAGGGTNRATLNYSAYTLAKIASIKMVELLAEEYPELCFTILGPGWVKTKIHDSTLSSPGRSGDNYATTLRHFEQNDFFPIEDLMKCIDWLFQEDTFLISGRNFSAVHDAWGSDSLNLALRQDRNLYKLRRAGNDEGFVPDVEAALEPRGLL